MRSYVALGAALFSLGWAPVRPQPARQADVAAANDNRRAAGRMLRGALTLELEARAVTWYPEAEGRVEIPSMAFAERGKRAMIPGPLIRVRQGATVNATMRNMLPRPLTLRGLGSRRSATLDSVVIAPGDTHTVRFVADVPGTFYYWGRAEAGPAINGMSSGRDGALVGAFIVDAAGARVDPAERIFVFTSIADTVAGLGIKPDAADRVTRRELIPRDRWFIVAMNGKSWPYTERLAYTVGDTVRFRLVNGGLYPHPMHLHGFYYTVEARGDARVDTSYAPGMQRDVVTEWMIAGHTMRMSWVPTRPGNWLFHCHLVTHMADVLRLEQDTSGHAHLNHAERGMAGLVAGIRVAPARGASLAAEAAASPKRLHVFVTEKARVYGDQPALSYVLQEGATPPARDSILPGSSTLRLRQGQPTEITVTNLSSQQTAVHWHGLELDSYYDGVGGWSGAGKHVAPMIAPGDSFIARITPPRAGTFMYHTHADEGRQLASGLYGALLVHPPAGAPDTTERVFLIAMGGPDDDAVPVINGAARPDTVRLTRGTTHRFRIINISPMETRTVQLLKGDSAVQWRAVAKDGAELRPERVRWQAATLVLHAGEAYDFEVRRAEADTLTFRMSGAHTISRRFAWLATARPGERAPRLVVDVPVLVR